MSNITHYELTTIIDSNIPDNEHSEIIDRMKKLISDNKGEISSENNLGRKKLSYPIEKLLKGVFICLEFDTEPQTLKSIEKELKLDKTIIRYLLIKKPKNVKSISLDAGDKVKKPRSEERISKPAPRKEVSEEIAPSISEDNEEDEKEVVVEEAKETVKKDNEDDRKSDLNDLDKKLDEILNDEIIN